MNLLIPLKTLPQCLFDMATCAFYPHSRVLTQLNSVPSWSASIVSYIAVFTHVYTYNDVR